MWEWGWLEKYLIFLSLLNIAHLVYWKFSDLFNFHLQKNASHLAYSCEVNLFYLLLITYSVSDFSNIYYIIGIIASGMDFSSWTHLDLFWGKTMVTLICWSLSSSTGISTTIMNCNMGPRLSLRSQIGDQTVPQREGSIKDLWLRPAYFDNSPVLGEVIQELSYYEMKSILSVP